VLTSKTKVGTFTNCDARVAALMQTGNDKDFLTVGKSNADKHSRGELLQEGGSDVERRRLLIVLLLGQLVDETLEEVQAVREQGITLTGAHVVGGEPWVLVENGDESLVNTTWALGSEDRLEVRQ
jgi:hypothetical protein